RASHPYRRSLGRGRPPRPGPRRCPPFATPRGDRPRDVPERGGRRPGLRAAVRLKDVWLVGGVFVDPGVRGRGVGRVLVEAAVASAREARARVGLYVREDRLEARRLYEQLGFRPVGRRTWLDLGADFSP